MSKLAGFNYQQGVDALYGGFKGLYRTGLLTWLNAIRSASQKAPVAYPEVGGTPSSVIWENGPVKLLRYGGPQPQGAPVLLVPSLINRHYVMDLLPERSVVKKFRDAGLDVYVMDWGSAGPQDVHNSLGHYALRLLPEAASHIPSPPHVLGYCMGGTLALGAIASGRLKAASMVAMATPVDCDQGGMLTGWVRQGKMDPSKMVEAFGNVPAYILQPAFKMMDPMGMATKFVHTQQKAGDDEFCRFFLAMETWLEDNVPFPGKAFEEWIGNLYRDNALMQGGWTMDGTRIDLKKVTCPVLTIVAEEDYICPPAASEPLKTCTGSKDVEFITMKGGHIGLTTGGGAHKNLWPKVTQWMLQRSKGADVHAAPAQRAAVDEGSKPVAKAAPAHSNKQEPVEARSSKTSKPAGTARSRRKGMA